MAVPEGSGGNPPRRHHDHEHPPQQVPVDPPAAIEDNDNAMIVEGPNERTLHLWREVAQAIDENQSGK